jgi:hypothetical protein
MGARPASAHLKDNCVRRLDVRHDLPKKPRGWRHLIAVNNKRPRLDGAGFPRGGVETRLAGAPGPATGPVACIGPVGMPGVGGLTVQDFASGQKIGLGGVPGSATGRVFRDNSHAGLPGECWIPVPLAPGTFHAAARSSK